MGVQERSPCIASRPHLDFAVAAPHPSERANPHPPTPHLYRGPPFSSAHPPIRGRGTGAGRPIHSPITQSNPKISKSQSHRKRQLRSPTLQHQTMPPLFGKTRLITHSQSQSQTHRRSAVSKISTLKLQSAPQPPITGSFPPPRPIHQYSPITQIRLIRLNLNLNHFQSHLHLHFPPFPSLPVAILPLPAFPPHRKPSPNPSKNQTNPLFSRLLIAVSPHSIQ